VKRGMLVAFGFVAALGASYAYFFFASGDGSVDGWVEWLVSFWSRAVMKSDAISSGDAHSLAIDMIAGFEGFFSHAYYDAAGVLTIGYGHKVVDGDGFDETSTIGEGDALALLDQDVASAEACVNDAVTNPNLTPDQVASLVSFTYNEGCGALTGSTLLKAVNAGDLATAANEFGKWNKAHVSGVLTVLSALTSRRAQEAAAFQA